MAAIDSGVMLLCILALTELPGGVSLLTFAHSLIPDERLQGLLR